MGTVPDHEWMSLLEEADKTLSSICLRAYDEDHTECLPVYAKPIEKVDYIKTKKAALGSSSSEAAKMLVRVGIHSQYW